MQAGGVRDDGLALQLMKMQQAKGIWAVRFRFNLLKVEHFAASAAIEVAVLYHLY